MKKKYYFIGAGGVGMSGLAKLLMKNGSTVIGSDQEASAVITKLRSLGADIKIGHDKNGIDHDIDAVVISAAIKEDNPELVSARRKNLKVCKYAEMLGELMDGYDGIAVCGTHGKSSTSGWLTFVLQEAGLEPSFIIGAEILQSGSSSGVGNGRCFVAEACEYDRSFLNLRPQIGVLLNIEQDHLDYYSGEAEIVEAFAEFADGVRDGGTIIANSDDKNVEAVLSGLKPGRKVVTFGSAEECDYSARNIEQSAGGWYKFDAYYKDSLLGQVRLALPGRHNVSNSLAVLAAAVSAGVKVKTVLGLLGQFMGMDRRLMVMAQRGGVTMLDDYAHHPTEIRASLEAIVQRFGGNGRVWCVFQPHQYSRTRFLLDDFAESFKLADITIVPQIYFVRDTAQAKRDVNAQVLVERIRQRGSEAVFIEDFGSIVEYLKNNVMSGDVVVTMGAGDIWKVADEYIQWLGTDS